MTLGQSAAADILYAWACGKMTTAQAKRACLETGYEIDFRQPDRGPAMMACRVSDGQCEWLEF